MITSHNGLSGNFNVIYPVCNVTKSPHKMRPTFILQIYMCHGDEAYVYAKNRT